MVRRAHVAGALVAIGAVLVLAGCSTSPTGQPASTATSSAKEGQETATQAGASSPVQTTGADWQEVADALGRSGQLEQGGVYRVSFPRRDLTVTSTGVRVEPGLALGSYAAFARYADGTTVVMGDLVVTEDELPKVTDTLHRNGIAQTAVHKHLLKHTPPVWWTHFHAESDDPVAVARGIKQALDVTATPPATPEKPPAHLALDAAKIDKALGTEGSNDGGIYKFSFARNDEVTQHGRTLPPATGVTTALNFQPTGGGEAAINGDFAMTADEVQPVIRALRSGGIKIVELHNHALADQPRLFYLHFWATDDAVDLATTLRKAVDAQDVTPAP